MLLCIDYQPAYVEAFADVLPALRKRLLRAFKDQEEVYFIYNQVFSLEGEELGDPLDRVLEWGRRERLVMKNARLLRKNFGWVSHLFRDGVERTIGITILRHLIERNIATSAEMEKSELERIVASAHGNFAGFWDCSPEAWDEILIGAIALPFIFEGGVTPWLESLQGKEIEVIGGFRHRCLDEMCMMLEAGGISYRLNETLIYSLPEEAALLEAVVIDSGAEVALPLFPQLFTLNKSLPESVCHLQDFGPQLPALPA